MSIFQIKFDPTATDISAQGDLLRVFFADGRELSVPLEWFPRLRDATEQEKANWRFIGRGKGIHWPDLDEDISVESLLRLS